MPVWAGAQFLSPVRGPVQDLAENPVHGGRHIGPLLVIEARQPVLPPDEFGVGQLPDLRVRRRDHGCRGDLLLPGQVGGDLG